MKVNITYEKIYDTDYEKLTKLMTVAFNEDTAMHTDLAEDGPKGYNDGSLVKKLNENDKYENYKIMYNGIIVGAYTVAITDDNVGSLEMLYIAPDYRRLHLGTVVWEDIESRHSSVKKWTVETPDYSIRNHHFYIDKCGFSFVRENIYAEDCKSHVFEKKIFQKNAI